MQMSYWRFAAMIATSTVVMFGLMYLTTYAIDHVFWSETRAWMALLMGATMAAIMLGFMLSMYTRRALNIAIFAGSVVVFALALWLVRSQSTVNDVDYMKAMIPHHSIAVMTSERAQITDPRVRKLADEIIAAQRREIAEMKYLVAQIESGAGEVEALDEAAAAPRVVPAHEAMTQAEIAKTDLAELDQAEIEKVLGRGPHCSFRYSRAAGPVAAFTPAGGVIKLHGRLVELDSAIDPKQDLANGVVLTADGVRLRIDPHAGAPAKALSGLTVHEADAVLTLAAGLDVGYRGYYGCASRADAASSTR
ncbi:DUF305 domain-containing protein [Lysobacter korlensis]|uniref:DUF305 domain-containing protein n=1 Tax=Lysobacter korlensis TaxID=553636 RepID=A0ABV6RH95_9GAMM